MKRLPTNVAKSVFLFLTEQDFDNLWQLLEQDRPIHEINAYIRGFFKRKNYGFHQLRGAWRYCLYHLLQRHRQIDEFPEFIAPKLAQSFHWELIGTLVNPEYEHRGPFYHAGSTPYPGYSQPTVDAVPIVDALRLLPTRLIAEHTTNLLAQAERRETVKTQLGFVTIKAPNLTTIEPTLGFNLFNSLVPEKLGCLFELGTLFRVEPPSFVSFEANSQWHSDFVSFINLITWREWQPDDNRAWIWFVLEQANDGAFVDKVLEKLDISMESFNHSIQVNANYMDEQLRKENRAYLKSKPNAQARCLSWECIAHSVLQQKLPWLLMYLCIAHDLDCPVLEAIYVVLHWFPLKARI